ncbi:AMP-binding protein [Maribacter chungangensis]|uniref:AMP-binding protein n=1 Tax=Maribacter chungangensis TaxID=1069117 RepID=A0ABW3B259_9FLAO
MKTIHLHPKFQLNGCSYTTEALIEHAYTLVKEGEAHEKSIGDFLLDWFATAPRITVRTSGSTGTPKAITIKKKQMVHSALATGEFFGLEAGNTALHCLPTHFIAGKMMLVRAMVLGLRLTCVAPTSTPIYSKHKHYDFAAMVPMQLRNTLDFIDCIGCLIVGGAPFSQGLKNEVAHKRTKIYETYGMTETVTHIAVKPVNRLDEIDFDKLNVFTLVPDVGISKDTRGCLVIDAPKVADDAIITNDLVEVLSETEFRWLGRYDNVINSGGIKLIPEQIEAVLSNLISGRFFVAGLADEVLGEKLVLVVEGTVDAAEIQKLLNSAEGLSKYQIPKQILVLPKFLETETGKIHRSKTLGLLTT